MTMRTLLLFVLTLLLSPLACSGDDSSGGPAPGQTTVDCDQLCANLDEAPTPQALRLSQAASCICNNLTQCEAPVDCEGRLTPSCVGAWSCQDTFCVWLCDEVTDCRLNSDCPGNQLCRGGACVEPGVRCQVDADCAGEQVCYSGRCVAPECQVDDDCADAPLPPECPNPEVTCLGGTCEVTCSSTPPPMCDGLISDYTQLSEQLAACDEGDTTCTVINNPACGLFPGAGDCWLAVNTTQGNAALSALAEGILDCVEDGGVCACPEPVLNATCVAGRCQIEGE